MPQICHKRRWPPTDPDGYCVHQMNVDDGPEKKKSDTHPHEEDRERKKKRDSLIGGWQEDRG